MKLYIWGRLIGEMLQPGNSGLRRGQMLSKRHYGGCGCLGRVVGWEI